MTFITKWFDSFQMFSKQTERKQSYALEYNSTLTPINFKSEVDEQRNQSVEIFAKLKTVNQLSIPFKCHILNHYLLYSGKANHSWLTFMFYHFILPVTLSLPASFHVASVPPRCDKRCRNHHGEGARRYTWEIDNLTTKYTLW